MPSRRFRWLAAKEFRELMASRAFWLLLLMIGPLVGHGFITAVDTYAEASGIAGGPAALAQGLSPLDGILVPPSAPTISPSRCSSPSSPSAWSRPKRPAARGSCCCNRRLRRHMLLAKGLTLLAGWLIAWIPGLCALVLWKLYGGTLYAPEVLNLLLGHLLRFVLAAGLAVAAGAIANGAASAAIATLGFTVGTWALEFIAAGRGGTLQKLASYTPTAALRVFEQGQFRLRTVLVTRAIGIAGFASPPSGSTRAAPCARAAWRPSSRCWSSPSLCVAASRLRTAWDLSENRRNSFSAADEAALARIRQPLRVTVFLSPEDPRLMDLDRNILAKLARILPEVEIVHAAHSRAGLFEAPGDHYGEVWYELAGRKSMTRSTTEPIVLDNLYQLAQVPPPVRDESEFPGHPLPATPRGAAWLYYAVWPLATASPDGYTCGSGANP